MSRFRPLSGSFCIYFNYFRICKFVGKVNREIKYTGGQLTLTYEDGKGHCHGKFNRTTVITFLCDHSTYGTAGPTFINETNECTYMFEWSTVLACMPFEMSDCTIQARKILIYLLCPVLFYFFFTFYDMEL